MGEHKTGLGELHGSLSLVWGSVGLVWADNFLTCFSLSENSSKTHFCPKINETQFCREFVLSFLFRTDFTDNYKFDIQKWFFGSDLLDGHVLGLHIYNCVP